MTAELTERGIIAHIRGRTTGSPPGAIVAIGDDCAVLQPTPGLKLLATTDLLIEDVHFRRRYTEPADLGWKALAVNLSDIASMGGTPRWALVALGCPAGTSVEEIEAFYEGMLALAAHHEVSVVGGDTSAAPTGWIINVTVLGEVDRPLLRATARDGDTIAVTGPLGRAAAGLAVLEHDPAPAGLPAAALADVTAAQRRPSPRVRQGRWLGAAEAVNAMIDLSDGLATDLGHISEESNLGARVDLEALPLNEATRGVAEALGRDARVWATGGGEDYELLLTCAPAAFQTLSDALERATGTRLHAVGVMTGPGTGVRFVDGQGREVAVGSGFQHFAARRRGGTQ